MRKLLLFCVYIGSLSAGCVPSSQRKQSTAQVYVQPPVHPAIQRAIDQSLQADPEGAIESLRVRDAIAVILRYHDQEERKTNGSTTSRR